MKVDYIVNPTNDIRILTNANRILSSNLMENDKLDVNFNSINISNFFNSMKEVKKMEDILEKTDEKMSALKKWVGKYSFREISCIEFKKVILDHIKNDIILYSASAGQEDLDVISLLLKNGNRVVVGGSGVSTFSISFIRRLLESVYNCSKKLLNNVIFVEGLVNSETDIHEIIINWKDIRLESRDCFWGTKSHYSKYLHIIEALCKSNGLPFNNKNNIWSMFGAVCVPFKSGCWWRKCNFCIYPSIKDGINYLKNLEPEYIADRIIDITKILNTKNIYITNDYFVFNKKTKKILQILKDNNIKPCVYTGIKLLTNDKYASNMAEYFGGIKMGLESVNDFTLKTINKGYTKKDILIAFNNIKKYFKKDAYINPNVILDLVSLGENEVLDDFSLLRDIKIDMKENGFDHFFYNFNILCIIKRIKDRILDGKLMVENNDKYKSTTGKFLLRELFEKGNIHIPKESWATYKQDYKRFGIDGKEMRSDIDIMKIEDMKYLFA